MEIGFQDLIFIIVFLFVVLLSYGKHKINFFARRGVRTLPTYPFVGNLLESMTKKKHANDIVHDAYNAFPEERYIGFLQFQRPNLIIKDLEIIKNITIKDFEYFQDRQAFIDEDSDPLFGRNLFSLTGQTWREMRATLSPAYTSLKMKQMFEHIIECGEQMVNYYKEKVNETKDNLLEIEMKDAFTRYANDVIATTAFGIKVDSFKNSKNEFYTMGKEATTFSPLQFLKVIFGMYFPNISKFLQITFFGKNVSDFFKTLVLGQMKYREENSIIRQDMIHLLMEAKKGSLKHDIASEIKDMGFATVEESKIGKEQINRDWTDNDIVAQAILFFIAGFDTSATILSFLANELAINPDIQSTLQFEIDELYTKCNGKLTYNDLQHMKYMDMVVSEILRKWPSASFIDRKCVKPYKLLPAIPNSKPYNINVNEGIWIPVYSIHRDPQYFPDPHKFDPERFSDSNKKLIQPFTYMPFGLGPRNCIGSRFALMEIKSVIFLMLKNFEFFQTMNTSNPIELSPGELTMVPKNGFWIGLKNRHRE